MRLALLVGLALTSVPAVSAVAEVPGTANEVPGTANEVPAIAVEAALDKAFTAFWHADDAPQREAAIQTVLATGASFESIWARLEAGRPYSADVDTGRIDLSHKTKDKTRHHFRVLVPKDYDPAKRYPVHFYLHGGVSRPAWRKGGAWWSNYDRFESPDRISVFPSSWDASMWWSRRQAENLPAILERLKHTYNVDENRVHLFGISDGATGAYFFAFRDPTPWASFLPFIGHPAVLDNRRLGVDGEMYPRNLAARPFFVVNGGQDRLYPAARVLPYLDLMQRAGTEVVFRHFPEGGHDTRWWPDEVDNIRAFLQSHPRDPLPEQLTWQTETSERYQRNAWLLITTLGPTERDQPLDDFNSLRYPPSLGFRPDPESSGGVRVDKVYNDSVADQAGLEKGDRIVAAAGTPTSTIEQLSQVIATHGGWGTTLPAAVERRGERLELTFQTPQSPPPDELTPAFQHRLPSGRIELSRRGNRIEVQSERVRRFKLLLSPLEIDFDQPLTVITNGEVSFDGRLELDARTLLEWAARDTDRTMLFAAELELDV
ncbi:MAG: PDZ domain-containing protein [Acidobacteriota bacterium]